jgi:signal transduction histidine kinase
MYIPYRNIFSYLHEGVMVLDPKHRILEINEAASLLFDQDQALLRGRDLNSIDSPLKEYYPVLTGNDGTKFTIHKRKDQTDYFFLVEMYPVYNSKDTITCRMVILHDITDITKSNKALEEAGTKLSLLNSITRHDILNQIAIVSGYTNILIDSSYNPDLYNNHLKIIRESSDMMKNLIQFTATYQNLGVESPVWLSVERLAIRAWKTLRNTDSILLNVHSDIEVFADLLLEKVFFNLFDNSIRHGGAIHTITIFSYEEKGTHYLVYEDDGMGIEPEIKHKIFNRGFGKNTGYGLFLIREILSITSITINETGIYGKGVRFEMVIPPGGVRQRSDNSGVPDISEN